MFLILFGISCQAQLPITTEPQQGRLTFMFPSSEQAETTEAFQRLHEKYPDSQIFIADTASIDRGILSNLPRFLPDVAFQQKQGSAEMYFPPTGRSIEIPNIDAEGIVGQFPEIADELSVPQRKKRMALVSAYSSGAFESALSVYVAAQMRWTEEKLSLHPAIQLAYGGGVHTNVMLDKHVKDKDWEQLLQEAAPWPCGPHPGGGSAQFHVCQIPSYPSACLKKSSSVLKDVKNAANNLQRVKIPEELKTSRSENAQADLDGILLSHLRFSTPKTICTTSGCHVCASECSPSNAQSNYQPLAPHDAAWRFCTDGFSGSGTSYCAQLRFDEDVSHPVISLHGDPCSENNSDP